MKIVNKNHIRVAVVQPFVVYGGGTEAITAWTIEALKLECHVTLISFTDVKAHELNRFYGTDIRENQFSLRHIKVPLILRYTSRFTVLKDHLMMRYCKSINEHFDLFISIGGAMDFESKTIQYFALSPGSNLVKILRKGIETSVGYYLLKKSFMRVCELISNYSPSRVKNNITLVASEWLGRLIDEIYSITDYKVVYPPVQSSSRATSWHSRTEGFLCVARISPEKQIERVVEIIKIVRSKGFHVTLHVVGRTDNHEYLKKIRQLSGENSYWLSIEEVLGKDELVKRMNEYKYGISAATGEPFGMAVAEMVQSGCIVFVSDTGGQREIVDMPELIFKDVHDAVGKIIETLNSSGSEMELIECLETKGKRFSVQNFCHMIKKSVYEALDAK